MNKGRNIAIVLACLLCLSLLTALVVLSGSGRNGVVDGVRYMKVASSEVDTKYSFYHRLEDKEKLISQSNHFTFRKDANEIIRSIVSEGSITKDGDNYFIYITDYKFSYELTGSDRDDATIIAYNNESSSELSSKDSSDLSSESSTELSSETSTDVNSAFDIYSKELFITMVFGKRPLLTVSQAIIIASIIIMGGLLIGYAEELWHIVYKKHSDEDPKWEELNIFKNTGKALFVLAAIILMVFLLFL